eukprot:7595000-Pyramimonas_sp.AAC.1
MWFVGENAFALTGEDADPVNGAGAVGVSPDKFFQLQRGPKVCGRCVAVFQLVYDEASYQAGLIGNA